MVEQRGASSPYSGAEGGQHEGSARAVAFALARFLRTLPRLKAQINARAQEDAVHASSIVVLRTLIDAGPQRSSAIADALDLDPSWISRQVNHLVQSGLVERRIDPRDGRAIILAATAAGEEACARAHQISIEYLAARVANWSENDRMRLAVLLDRFTRELELDSTPDPTRPILPPDAMRRSHE
jgi:DNA-binding MarR family transcriptional regulator